LRIFSERRRSCPWKKDVASQRSREFRKIQDRRGFVGDWMENPDGFKNRPLARWLPLAARATGAGLPMATAAEVPTHAHLPPLSALPPLNDLASRAKQLLRAHGGSKADEVSEAWKGAFGLLPGREGFVCHVDLQSAIDKHSKALADHPLPAAGLTVDAATKKARKRASDRLAYKVTQVEAALDQAEADAAAAEASRVRSEQLDSRLHELHKATPLERAWETQNFYQALLERQETGRWKAAPSPQYIAERTLKPLLGIPNGLARGFLLRSCEMRWNLSRRPYTQGTLELTFTALEQPARSKDAELRGAVAAGLAAHSLPTGLHFETDAAGRPVDDIGPAIDVAGLVVTLGPFSEMAPCHGRAEGSFAAGRLLRSPGLFYQSSGKRKSAGAYFFLDPAMAAEAAVACRKAAREVLVERALAEDAAAELRAEQALPLPVAATANGEVNESVLGALAVQKRFEGLGPEASALVTACFKK
jgi:hypothetical protein